MPSPACVSGHPQHSGIATIQLLLKISSLYRPHSHTEEQTPQQQLHLRLFTLFIQWTSICCWAYGMLAMLMLFQLIYQLVNCHTRTQSTWKSATTSSSTPFMVFNVTSSLGWLYKIAFIFLSFSFRPILSDDFSTCSASTLIFKKKKRFLKRFWLKKNGFYSWNSFFFVLWRNNSSVKFKTINNKVKTKTCKINNNRNTELSKLDLAAVIHLKFYFQIS